MMVIIIVAAAVTIIAVIIVIESSRWDGGGASGLRVRQTQRAACLLTAARVRRCRLQLAAVSGAEALSTVLRVAHLSPVEPHRDRA